MSSRDLLRPNDLRFLDVTSTLSPGEWSAASLCEGWTNHQVLAHLVVGYGGGLGPVVSEMYRHGGSFDGANTTLACSLAQMRSPAELLEDFSRLIDQPKGIGRLLPRRMMVGDHVTHEISLNPAASQSMHVSAVNVSFTAADRARMAISTIWSIAKTGSWTSVRCGPVTWALESARDTSGAALGGYTRARARRWPR